MAINACSLCFLAWLARASSARLAVAQDDSLPWRKTAAVGTVLGTTLSRHSVAASVEKEVGQAADLHVEPTSDAYARLDQDLVGLLQDPDLDDEVGQTADVHAEPTIDEYARAEKDLVALLQDNGLDDEALIEKLLSSLRQRERIGAEVVRTLCLSSRGDSHALDVLVENSGNVQQILVPDEDGKGDIVITRYLAHRREEQAAKGVQKMLGIMEMSNLFGDGLFLGCLAQSHTLEEFAKDTDAEVVTILEPFSGSLQKIVPNPQASFSVHMLLIIDLLEVLVQLHDLNIPHMNNIGLDTVLFHGHLDDPASIAVLLSPSILEGQTSTSALASFDADVKQFGALVRMLLDRTWLSAEKPKIDVVLALAKALESGAVSGVETVKQEFAAMMLTVLSPDSTKVELLKARMKYLRLALSRARASAATPAPEPVEA